MLDFTFVEHAFTQVNSFARRSICEKASPKPLPMLRGCKEEPCKCAIMPWCEFYFSLNWACGQRQPREEVGTSFEHIRVPAGRAAKQKISQKFLAFRRWTMSFQSYYLGTLSLTFDQPDGKMFPCVTGGCMGSKVTATWRKMRVNILGVICWVKLWSSLRMKLIWTKVTWIAVAYLLGTFGALVRWGHPFLLGMHHQIGSNCARFFHWQN